MSLAIWLGGVALSLGVSGGQRRVDFSHGVSWSSCVVSFAGFASCLLASCCGHLLLDGHRNSTNAVSKFSNVKCVTHTLRKSKMQPFIWIKLATRLQSLRLSCHLRCQHHVTLMIKDNVFSKNRENLASRIYSSKKTTLQSSWILLAKKSLILCHRLSVNLDETEFKQTTDLWLLLYPKPRQNTGDPRHAHIATHFS